MNKKILILCLAIFYISTVYAVPAPITSCSSESCMLTIPRYKIFQSMIDPDTVWVMTQNSRDTNLFKTINGGNTWDAAPPTDSRDLNIQWYLDYHSSLGGDELDNLYVADRCYECDSNSQVFFRKLSAPADKTTDFQTPIYINGVNPGVLQTPNILVQNSTNIFVIMRTSGSAGGNIYAARSTNGGQSFGTPQVVADVASSDVRIGSFMIENIPAVILHYRTAMPGSLDYEYFIWNGNNWIANADSVILATTESVERHYSMAYANGRLHLVTAVGPNLRHLWKDYGMGTTWNSENIETLPYTPMEWTPSLSVHGNDIYVFYARQESTTTTNNNIYYRKWNDTSTSWSPAVALTSDGAWHHYPHGPAIVNPSSNYIPVAWNNGDTLTVYYDRVPTTPSSLVCNNNGVCENDGETCSNCPDDCLDSGEVCCLNNPLVGDCCSDLDCSGLDTCQANICTVPEPCDDGFCNAGDNCPLLNSTCPDNECYEPACTNGCQEIPVAYGMIDEVCAGNNYCDNGLCIACRTDLEQNCDGKVDGAELVIAINNWFVDAISVQTLMQSIKFWKLGRIL